MASLFYAVYYLDAIVRARSYRLYELKGDPSLICFLLKIVS